MFSLDFISGITSTFSLVFLAEMGDKSQLVCMTLAARYRHTPVFLGASAAFLVLNTLAVLFGASLAHWIPEQVVAAIVAIMFAVFGVKSLLAQDEDDNEEINNKLSHGIFVSTFLMLLLAEMGDKTQIAVAGLAGTIEPVAVWLGATASLIITSALGVWLGKKLLKRVPMKRVHQLSGIFFLALAAFAATRLL